MPAGVTVTNLVYNYPLARLWEFTLGIAAAHVLRYLHLRLLLSRLRGTLLELATVGGVLLVMYQSLAWTQAINQRWAIGAGGFLWVLETGLVSVMFAALLCVLGCEQGWVPRVLSWSPLVLLGEVSYSIYLLHIPLLLYILYHPDRFARVPPDYLYLFYWLVLLLSAYLSWSVIERPVRRVVVLWWDRRFGEPSRSVRAETQDPVRSQPRPGLATPTWRRSLVAICAMLCIGVALFAAIPMWPR